MLIVCAPELIRVKFVTKSLCSEFAFVTTPYRTCMADRSLVVVCAFTHQRPILTTIKSAKGFEKAINSEVKHCPFDFFTDSIYPLADRLVGREVLTAHTKLFSDKLIVGYNKNALGRQN